MAKKKCPAEVFGTLQGFKQKLLDVQVLLPLLLLCSTSIILSLILMQVSLLWCQLNREKSLKHLFPLSFNFSNSCTYPSGILQEFYSWGIRKFLLKKIREGKEKRSPLPLTISVPQIILHPYCGNCVSILIIEPNLWYYNKWLGAGETCKDKCIPFINRKRRRRKQQQL